MSRLVKRVEQEGFAYFDWNVDSVRNASAGLSAVTESFSRFVSGMTEAASVPGSSAPNRLRASSIFAISPTV